MSIRSEYKSKVHEVFFNNESKDLLFKDGVTPYVKDKFRFERAVTLLSNPRGKTIYELGPYPGTGIYYFGEFNHILGVGKSNPDFLKKTTSLGHKLIDIDFEYIKKGELSGQADIVLVMEVLEHIRMSYKFIGGIIDVVKPGGVLYLTTNNQSYIGYLVKLILNKPILDPIETEGTFYPGHCRYYSLNELVSVFEKSGFLILESNYVNFIPGYKLYKNKRFGAIKNAFLRLFPKRFSTHIEILVKRPE
ncbi:methyltransferase domain-containing protein [Pedobacter sp. PLR]|uniref:methyltransferase domain-containing protein n=1 Tax=Pedobacter sp. PLR TaxID=2994465 RepID=UPI002247CE7B|nr:methyltransferase domain-containing protein [Pedobacter sp. PLR]MCX2453366.1 methyltransferase domain-containing protein [Pedobacter sp. PLR]